MRTAYIGKTRKCSCTIGSILISNAFDAAVLTAIMNSHICFMRHAKEKTMFYIYSQMVCFEWCLPFSTDFFGKMVYFFVGK